MQLLNPIRMAVVECGQMPLSESTATERPWNECRVSDFPEAHTPVAVIELSKLGEIEVILQAAREQHPQVRPLIISDNAVHRPGPQGGRLASRP
jgi:hypothetical protein